MKLIRHAQFCFPDSLIDLIQLISRTSEAEYCGFGTAGYINTIQTVFDQIPERFFFDRGKNRAKLANMRRVDNIFKYNHLSGVMNVP